MIINCYTYLQLQLKVSAITQHETQSYLKDCNMPRPVLGDLDFFDLLYKKPLKWLIKVFFKSRTYTVYTVFLLLRLRGVLDNREL